LAAVAFVYALEGLGEGLQGGLLHYHPPARAEDHRPRPITEPSPIWLLVLLPALGGLAAGLIVASARPAQGAEAEVHGTDAIVRAFHRGGGHFRARDPLVIGSAALLTLATGGSAGPEGPVGQIGAGIGSTIARLLRLTPGERRLLMLAGAAGGIGAVFRAPLGGALFVVEVLYSTTAIEAAALLPCLAGSIVAYSTFALFNTPSPVFAVPNLRFRGLFHLPLFALLALACAATGWLFVRVYHGMHEYVFKPLPLPRPARAALGGLLLGLLAILFPQLLGIGYGWMQWGAVGMPPHLVQAGESAFLPNLGIGMLLLLALLKTVATGLTLGSGGSGGLFAPTVFIGGMLGGAVGQGLDLLIGQELDIEPAAYVLVGMGGFFAATSKTPLAAILMVAEMTGSYNLLVPLMLACGLNMGLSRRWTLYREQVPSPIDSPAHQGDFVVDVLERLRVGQVGYRAEGLELMPESLSFDQVLRRVANSSETLYPVVDPSGRLTGIFSLRDVRLALQGSNLGGLVVAADLGTRAISTVTPNDDLNTALKRMTELNLDEIPVVAPDDPTRLLGLFSRKTLVAAYTAQIEALRRPGAAVS
ncbi:MAG: chloride channel protein, partial [Isosphaeraceae bacterium]|nr:chloride channel protein [Isosphaeraceae bacterium]